MFALLLACATDPAPLGGDNPVCASYTEVDVTKHLGDPPRAARTLTGSLTFVADFDSAAEATGMVDCSYTREYPLLPEITDQGWLCPDCDWVTKGTGTVVSGYEDCYLKLSSNEAARVEHLGLVPDGATYAFWRSSLENVSLTDTGARLDPAALGKGARVAWVDGGELDTGGAVTLSASGVFTAATSDTLLVDDPAGARTDPYTCGWPLQSPGGPVLDWSPDPAGTFPNARLLDACGEQVDVWDFRGRYVVIDAAAPDCGPCQLMAETAEAFKSDMAERCIQVETITLLSEGLSGINKPAPPETLDAWIEAFGALGPVLADEGFGYGVVAPLVSDSGGMALPSAVVLGPDGSFLGGDHGYNEEEGWTRYARFIPGATN